MTYDCDVCVIGSGAGGGPIAYVLAHAGFSVRVLEKGAYYKENNFFKDEKGECIDFKFRPNPKLEPRSVSYKDHLTKQWKKISSMDNPQWNMWNATMVGGSTNIMSGFFHRLKPVDFCLKSAFGSISDGNIDDWPISYDDLEPYYDKVERIIGISGKVLKNPFQEPRSSPDFPYPALPENPLAQWIDEAGIKNGWHPFPTPRAILSQNVDQRLTCSLSGYCAGYGCPTGAKGSSRVALLEKAISTGNCQIYPQSMVKKIVTDSNGKISAIEYFEKNGKLNRLNAKIVVVACQAIESARLLLMSTGPKFPNGLANGSLLVGRNLIFSTSATGQGDFEISKFSNQKQMELKSKQPFINRAFQDWYTYSDKHGRKNKGGTIDLLLSHPNPIQTAKNLKNGPDGFDVWGEDLVDRLDLYFKKSKHIIFEAFSDWIPNDQCFVSLDGSLKDRWGLPVASVQIKAHKKTEEVSSFLAEKGRTILTALGASSIRNIELGAPSKNLVAGTCRFGNNPKFSVLDKDCRAHEVENLFVTDGSFMPTGGSVPFTWTIYANAFRVADSIYKQLISS